MRLKAQLDLLVQLQKHEFEARRLQSVLDEIPSRLEAFGLQKSDLSNQLLAEKQHIEDIKKQYRELEVRVQESDRNIEKSKDKLALVKTNKEYQSSLKEIEELENKIGATEDQMLELLEQTETAEKDYLEKERHYKIRCDQLDQAALQVQHEQKVVGQQLSDHNRTQEELRNQISADLISKYEHVQWLGVKIAIAPVVNAVCKGCNMSLPPQLFIELQRFDELKHCPQCQCIIYWEQEEEKETS